MNSQLQNFIDRIQSRDELIVSGFGIDEKVVRVILGARLARVGCLRLVYDYRFLRNPGFITGSRDSEHLFAGRLIHTPVKVDSSRRRAIYHTKFAALVDRSNGRRRVRRIFIPSYNWTTYHFSTGLEVIDSAIEFEGSTKGLDTLLLEETYSSATDFALVRTSPTLIRLTSEGRKSELEVLKKDLASHFRHACPESVTHVGAPFINETGLKNILRADQDVEGLKIFGRSAENGTARLHAKILVGRSGPIWTTWLGSTNFTSNALGGNNHEFLVNLRSRKKPTSFIAALGRFKSWSPGQNQSNELDREAEPEIVEDVPADLPMHAILIRYESDLYLALKFGSTFRRPLYVTLTSPQDYIRLERSRYQQSGNTLLFELSQRGRIHENVLEILRQIVRTSAGRVHLTFKDGSHSVELDLGEFWTISERFAARPKKISKTKRTPVFAPKSLSAPPLEGQDVRPVRGLMTKGSSDGAGLLAQIFGGRGARVPAWTTDWAHDPWTDQDDD